MPIFRRRKGELLIALQAARTLARSAHARRPARFRDAVMLLCLKNWHLRHALRVLTHIKNLSERSTMAMRSPALPNSDPRGCVVAQS
jgi:hypothetical protein